MDMSNITYILGWILNIEAALMTLPLITALIYGEKEGFAFAAVMAVLLLLLSYCMERNNAILDHPAAAAAAMYQEQE